MRFPIPPGSPGVSSRWKMAGAGGGFGADRDARTGRIHAGLDIGAPHATPVVAMEKGTVTERTKEGDSFLDAPLPLLAIAIRHASGFVARYGEINEIPGRLVSGATVSEGEKIGIVQQHSLHSRAKSMLHLEIYAGTRSGTLSVPNRLRPKLAVPAGKRKFKHPSEMTEDERKALVAAGYLPDYMRRADLVDPTEFLKRVESGGAAGPDTAVSLALIAGALLLGNAAAGAGMALGLFTGGAAGGIGVPAAGTGGGDPRRYAGPLSAHPSDALPPADLGPRDYFGPMDAGWEEEPW